MNDNIFNTQGSILVTCPKRLSTYLQKEIEGLDYKVENNFLTGVELKGTITDCINLNLHIRTGHRVLYLLHQFSAANPDDLYKGVYKFNWENYIPPDGYFSVISRVENETINNETFASLKCKDAIVDKFAHLFDKRPDSGPNKDKVVLFLHWKSNQVMLYLDTSGESLAKHGYRKIPYKAPLQETLAAAIIMATDWDHHSCFINPMCGSGTLAIEAALIAAERSPGLYRSNYGFMHVMGYDEQAYQEYRTKMKLKVVKSKVKIVATDIEPLAVEAAKQNAKTAGVDHLIDFSVCDFSETLVPEEKGIVIFNPEYGERLGEEEELEKVYKNIGDFFKQKCKGYTGYIFTGNLQLAKRIGLKTKRKIEFYNSTIDCRLLEYELYGGTRRVYPVSEQEPG